MGTTAVLDISGVVVVVTERRALPLSRRAGHIARSRPVVIRHHRRKRGARLALGLRGRRCGSHRSRHARGVPSRPPNTRLGRASRCACALKPWLESASDAESEPREAKSRCSARLAAANSRRQVHRCPVSRQRPGRLGSLPLRRPPADQRTLDGGHSRGRGYAPRRLVRKDVWATRVATGQGEMRVRQSIRLVQGPDRSCRGDSHDRARDHNMCRDLIRQWRRGDAGVRRPVPVGCWSSSGSRTRSRKRPHKSPLPGRTWCFCAALGMTARATLRKRWTRY